MISPARVSTAILSLTGWESSSSGARASSLTGKEDTQEQSNAKIIIQANNLFMRTS
jgi:hypothetical protein